MSPSGARFTFRANRDLGRHGWLRLTPAYSVGLVQELASELGPQDRVLDPFCGTGTTALVCAEQGIRCDTLDINPFLIWLARAKCASYSPGDVDQAREVIEIARAAGLRATEPALAQLAASWRAIQQSDAGESGRTLAKIAFCRAMIGVSKASFRHQSMSLSHDISHELNGAGRTTAAIGDAFAHIERSAVRTLGAEARVVQADARRLDSVSGLARYSAVITSPPYPNRMSYVRELRPYMYWLGFLSDGRSAGELDWEAIGGTWGIATSNLTRWAGEGTASAILDETVLEAIHARSALLANYVRKYVEDMATHIGSLASTLEPNARVTYIIGNSHFYGVPVETQEVFAELFRRAGFEDVEIRVLRKRTSKTGLFEYAVSARIPA